MYIEISLRTPTMPSMSMLPSRSARFTVSGMGDVIEINGSRGTTATGAREEVQRDRVLQRKHGGVRRNRRIGTDDLDRGWVCIECGGICPLTKCVALLDERVELQHIGIEGVLASLRPKKSGRINEFVSIYIERRAPRLGINTSTANDRSGRNGSGAQRENRQQKPESSAVARVHCQDSHLWQTSAEWRRR